MDYIEYASKLKNAQKKLLNFIDCISNVEENYDNFTKYLVEENFIDNKYKLKSILYMLTKVSENHYRSKNFFEKIEKILQFLKNRIKSTFSNSKVYEIFKRNRPILLFLMHEQMVTVDDIVYKRISSNDKDVSFFRPEIEKFKTAGKAVDKIEGIENLEEFKKKRQIGQNDNAICQIIREDLIDEFITFVKKNEYDTSSTIESSIFETNPFLIKRDPTLIEYAAFFGSVQIFKYLYLNGVKLDSSLWIYGVHGNDEEIIDILENQKIQPEDETFEEVLKEAIKCHNVDMMNYTISNLLKENVGPEKVENNQSKNILSYCFHYYNFFDLPKDILNDFVFYYACKYDYFLIVENFMKTKVLDINQMIICTFFFYLI